MAILIIIFAIFISLLIIVVPTFFSQDKTRIELDQNFKLKHILDDNKNIEFVFFGYVGCSVICSPRLSSLANWYKGLEQKVKDKFNVRFINLSKLKDSELPNMFAKTFNNDFIGLYLEGSKLREYTKPFLVYFSKSLSNDYEIDHTTHLYLVKKNEDNKSIKYIYNKYPYDFNVIEKDLKGLINE